jgi:hypothetical protein
MERKFCPSLVVLYWTSRASSGNHSRPSRQVQSRRQRSAEVARTTGCPAPAVGAARARSSQGSPPGSRRQAGSVSSHSPRRPCLAARFIADSGRHEPPPARRPTTPTGTARRGAAAATTSEASVLRVLFSALEDCRRRESQRRRRCLRGSEATMRPRDVPRIARVVGARHACLPRTLAYHARLPATGRSTLAEPGLLYP